MKFRAVQRPLIRLCRGKHRSSGINKEPHRTRDAATFFLCLPPDHINNNGINQRFRLRQPRKIDQICVIRLISSNHIRNQLVKLFLTDVRRFSNCFFNLFQANPLRPQRPDTLHCDFVELTFKIQPSANLIKQRAFKTSEEFG